MELFLNQGFEACSKKGSYGVLFSGFGGIMHIYTPTLGNHSTLTNTKLKGLLKNYSKTIHPSS